MCVTEIASLLNRLYSKFKDPELQTHQGTERFLDVEFNEKEQETLHSHILLTNVNLSRKVKHKVHQALQRLKNKRKFTRMQKNFATSDTAKFAQLFYRTPKSKFYFVIEEQNQYDIYVIYTVFYNNFMQLK